MIVDKTSEQQLQSFGMLFSLFNKNYNSLE